MIASVVATLEGPPNATARLLSSLRALPGVETGPFDETTRRLPITIESPTPMALEETTRHLRECRGVAFVDVVFVHFETEPEHPEADFR